MMRLIKPCLPFCFVVTLALAISHVATAQETSEARLVHSFNNLGTDYFRASIDALLTEMRDTPGSFGFVVIHPGSHSISHKFAVERRVRNHLGFRSISTYDDLPTDRVFIIRGAIGKETKIDLWLSNASINPNVEEAIWDYSLPSGVARLFFGEGNVEFSTSGGKRTVWLGECSLDCEPTSDAFIFSEYLRVNPQYNGRLIAYGDSKRKAFALARRLRSFLVFEYSIPKERISIEFGGKTKYEDFPEIGLWLVPSVKTN